jgi:tRNA(Ile)-lysidine synthase TilS/MesJ
MSELQTRVQAAIQQQRLFRRGDRIVVAVSGGVDSMVLLRLMDELAREYSWKLVVAHLNHMLRGRGSNADERLVREASSDAGLSFVSERVDVRRRAEQGRLSTEMAASRRATNSWRVWRETSGLARSPWRIMLTTRSSSFSSACFAAPAWTAFPE